jgi:hypothetical protein
VANPGETKIARIAHAITVVEVRTAYEKQRFENAAPSCGLRELHVGKARLPLVARVSAG